jgi:putative copper resistance protein D
VEPLLNFPLVAARAIHFVSTAQLAGILMFGCVVAGPALRKHPEAALPGLAACRSRLLVMAGGCLALTIVSAAAWLLLLSAQITESSPAQVLSDGTATTLLAHTRFGHDWQVRTALALALAAILPGLARADWARVPGRLPCGQRVVIAAALSAGLLGTLAWAGHAGAAPGPKGDLHLVSDVLHLVAAGAWIGGLVPLALLLSTARRNPGPAWMAVAREATRRFSTVGVAAVGTLTLTGLINTWALVDTLRDLVATLYGQILLLKVALFLAMLAIAAVNRLRLTPRLDSSTGPLAALDTLRVLRVNCLAETALGFGVLLAVSALGTLAPGMQM